MVAPLKPHLYPVVLHDTDANPIVFSGGAIGFKGVPGTVINAQPDTVVGIGATAPLPSPPATTRRMTIQNTGPSGSKIRVRQVGGAAGSGTLLTSMGSTTFGGADGAVADVEAEDVAGVATTVGMTFEED